MIIQYAQYISCILTAMIGALGLFAPHSVVNFTGLSPQGGRGITEIRVILGGLFLALGLAPFFLGDTAYTMLGVTYLALAAVRLPSILIDRSGTQSNWLSLASEIVLGFILIL